MLYFSFSRLPPRLARLGWQLFLASIVPAKGQEFDVSPYLIAPLPPLEIHLKGKKGPTLLNTDENFRFCLLAQFLLKNDCTVFIRRPVQINPHMIRDFRNRGGVGFRRDSFGKEVSFWSKKLHLKEISDRLQGVKRRWIVPFDNMPLEIPSENRHLVSC
jgi:hypothetical protein